jgi:hypothetical protein
MYAPGKMLTRNRKSRSLWSLVCGATLETLVLARISTLVCVAGPFGQGKD